MAMELSAELHRPLGEVLGWDLDVFYDWVVFYQIQEDKRKKSASKAKGPSRGRKPR